MLEPVELQDTASAQDLPVWSTTEQVAARYQKTPATVRWLKHAGKIKGVRFGKRTLYHRTEIERIDRELLDQLNAS